jgi:hypothetical protein
MDERELTDEEIVRDAVARNVVARDPLYIREARSLALEVLGPHPLGGHRDQEDGDRRDAVHESGHAAMCCLLHVPFAGVRVRPTPVTYGARYDPLRPHDRMMGAVAGALSELQSTGAVVAEGCLVDLRDALRAAGGDVSQVRAAAARAREMLRSRGEALGALKTVLLRKGQLSREECQRIVDVWDGRPRWPSVLARRVR